MSKKNKKQHKNNQPTFSHFELKEVHPLTVNQSETFDAFRDGKHLLLHGVAGTGKTYISLYLALREVIHTNRFKRIIVVRSVVPSRDMGFLPGSMREKIAVYEEPYRNICDDLFGRGDGYEILKTKHMVEFTTTSYLRGMTFDDAIIIVDEMQNLNFAELSTIMTRVGDNCRIIFCGDFRQTDLQLTREKQGLQHFTKILDNMKEFHKIQMSEDDIVRSGLVKSFIINMEKYRLGKNLVL